MSNLVLTKFFYESTLNYDSQACVGKAYSLFKETSGKEFSSCLLHIHNFFLSFTRCLFVV